MMSLPETWNYVVYPSNLSSSIIKWGFCFWWQWTSNSNFTTPTLTFARPNDKNVNRHIQPWRVVVLITYDKFSCRINPETGSIFVVLIIFLEGVVLWWQKIKLWLILPCLRVGHCRTKARRRRYVIDSEQECRADPRQQFDLTPQEINS